MRKINKGPPPRNVSPDGQASCGLITAEKRFRKELESAPEPVKFSRARFKDLDKKKLRAQLYAEQGHLCVFCQRRVKETLPEPRIDHWRPLSLNTEYALAWRNLHVSCTNRNTCDVAKWEWPLKWDDADPDLPWPSKFDFERHLGFTSLGEMYVRNDTGLDARVRKALELAIADQVVNGRSRKAILNLNHNSLVAERQEALDSEMEKFEHDFAGRHATPQERDDYANALLQDDHLPVFISIRLAWLKKLIGKGQ